MTGHADKNSLLTGGTGGSDFPYDVPLSVF